MYNPSVSSMMQYKAIFFKAEYNFSESLLTSRTVAITKVLSNLLSTHR